MAKRDDEIWDSVIGEYGTDDKKNITKLPFADYFNSNTILVPVPKRSLLKPGTLWVPERLQQHW